jgi:hypothetical protein
MPALPLAIIAACVALLSVVQIVSWHVGRVVDRVEH